MKNPAPLLARTLIAITLISIRSPLNVALFAQNAPTIVTQPANQIALVGSKAAFTVAASGTGPFTYQWRLNGTNLPNIITIAGGGINLADDGDGGPATDANLYLPIGLVVDGLGNLFIADRDNSRIRKVGADGIITTVAGNGMAGYSGDGGAATNASLDYPVGVAMDRIGNLFIAVSDSGDYRVRKVGMNGLITTVAGTGAGGYSGDGDAATNATLSYPSDVARPQLIGSPLLRTLPMEPATGVSQIRTFQTNPRFSTA